MSYFRRKMSSKAHLDGELNTFLVLVRGPVRHGEGDIGEDAQGLHVMYHVNQIVIVKGRALYLATIAGKGQAAQAYRIGHQGGDVA